MAGELGAADGRQALHRHCRRGQGGRCRAQVRCPLSSLPAPGWGLGKLLGFGPKQLSLCPHPECLVGYGGCWQGKLRHSSVQPGPWDLEAPRGDEQFCGETLSPAEVRVGPALMRDGA